LKHKNDTADPSASSKSEPKAANVKEAMAPERIEARASIVIAIFLLCVTGYQACVARDTLRDSQRPFLYVKRVKVIGGGPDGKGQYLIGIDISNSGQTQARNVRMTFGIGRIEGSVPPTWEPPTTYNFDETEKAFLNIIPPKEVPGTVTLIDTETVNDLMGLRKGLIVYGTIRYCDIFRIRHMTRFCQKFQFVTTEPNAPNEQTFNFGACIPHSCDDDDCRDYDPYDNGACR
jgi:hypothetical protein